MPQLSKSVGSYESGAVNLRTDVTTVQELLTQISKAKNNPSLDPNGIDGKIHRVGSKSGTVRAIHAFQASVVGMSRPDDRIDVGGRTWRKLSTSNGSAPQAPPPKVSVSGFAKALARIAEGEVGTMEASRNNTGADLEKYKEATWLAPGAWAWCAAFVCWCYQEALKVHSVSRVNRPRTAGAWDFERWAKTQAGVTLHKPPGSVQKGDIVVFTFSHIGIAVGNENNGIVPTVEGNTNVKGTRDGGGRTRDGVFRKSRPKSQIRSVIRTTG